MRPKLVFIASLLAAIVGAGVSTMVLAFRGSYWGRLIVADLSEYSILALVCIPPIASALLAGIFVYRHTARRRRLQAALTTVLVLVFCFLVGIAASYYLASRPLKEIIEFLPVRSLSEPA